MNTLSARRRHPLAAFVVLFFALTVIGAAYATLGSATASAAGTSGYTADQIAAGQKLFLSSCSSCHNTNGQGVQGSGPSLIGVGAAAVDFQVGTGRMPAMQIGPQVPSKPREFSDAEIADMAAFVSSLGAGPAVPTEDLYNGDPNNAASVSNGGVLFRTNCSQCHNIYGAGGALTDGKYAPPLKNTSPQHIYEAMLTGPQNMPIFNDNVMSPQNKKDIIAYLLHTRTGPNPGGVDLGAIGPVSEGLFVWTIVLGLLIVFACWIGAHTTKASRARVAHFEATTGKDATDND